MLALASRRREAIAGRLAVRWRREHLFHAWIALRAEAKRNAALSDNTRKSALSSTFGSWCDAAGEQAQLRSRLARVVARWRTGGLGKAMVAWETNAAATKRSRKVLDRVIGRWRMGVLAKALLSWETNAAEGNRSRKTLERVVGRWRTGALGNALLAWQTNSTETRRLRAVAERVRRSWLLSHHRKALAGWSFAVNRRVERRDKLTSVVAWWRNATLADAWWSWSESVHSQKLQDVRAEAEQLAAQVPSSLISNP